MKTDRKIIIGSRGSALALKQVDIVKVALAAANPALTFEVQIITTRGDVNQNPIPLGAIGKGWFTKEVEQGLSDGSIDLAVHSLKDMAQEMPVGLCIGAYLPREDARDALITKHGQPLEELLAGAVVGTDSARRQIQMLELRPDVVMQSLRGNVLTRLEKLMSENYDAIILAAAGLKRLGLEHRITRYFEPNEMTPAPGQGILAVQVREDNAPLREMLRYINDIDAAQIASIERSFSETTGGGCKSPTGAYAFREGNEYRLIGMVATDNKSVLRDEMRVPFGKSAELGKTLAEKLLQQLAGHGKNI